MIKALNIATQGMLQAERRATDAASSILKTVSEASSFSVDSAPEGGQSASQNSGANTKSVPGDGFGNLIQHFADLRAEENAFKASATAFKKIDETLGSLLDDES